MPSVFLSYSQSDLPSATQLAEQLATHSISVSLDDGALLLLWSKNSAASVEVEKEWNSALALKKPIIPLLLDQTPLPPALALLRAIPFSPAALAQIVATLNHQPPPAPKTKRLRWQALAALLGAILLASTLGRALWHNYISNPSASYDPDHRQNQPFAGSIRTDRNDPLPGVKVSLVLNENAIESGTTTVTDNLGHFAFQIVASPESDITILAQKPGFETERRYTKLGKTNFNFKMRGAAK